MRSKAIPFWIAITRKTQSYLATIDADLTDQTTLTFGVEYRDHAPTGTTWGNWPLVFADGSHTGFGRGFPPGWTGRAGIPR